MTDVFALAAEAHDVHGAQQKPWELERLGDLILERGLKNALEVGTYAGGTAWFLRELGLAVTAIDRRPQRRVEGVRYVVGDSAEVRLHGSWDLILIDADHSYEGVKADWERFWPMVNPGGVLAFHDIAEHPPEVGCEVLRLWGEIRHEHAWAEIVDLSDGSPWGGIGVVFA